jgi:pimeloyl-ACP methyl ester carboxylesterase
MDWLAGMMISTDLPAAVACNIAVAEADLRPDLAFMDRPTLIIHGDCDVSAPLAVTGEPTAAGIRDARLKVYPGAPHGLFITHAGKLNADIISFLQS